MVKFTLNRYNSIYIPTMIFCGEKLFGFVIESGGWHVSLPSNGQALRLMTSDERFETVSQAESALTEFIHQICRTMGVEYKITIKEEII